MKFLYTAVFSTMMMLVASCQDMKESKDSKVPQSVSANFQSKYPGENDPDWKLDANDNWEANFKIDGVKYRADYKPNGLWIETENSIDKNELPNTIRDAIERDYSDEKITEIERVTHHSKGLFYDVEFRRKGKNKDVEFREDGTELK